MQRRGVTFFLRRSVSNDLSVLLGKGDGSFQAPVNYPIGPGAGGPSSLAVKDFNGDGSLDLAVAFGGGVRVLLGNGDGTFQTTPISYVAGSDPLNLAVADFNGDGFADLAVTNGESQVTILFNDGRWTP